MSVSSDAEIEAAKAYLDEAAKLAGREPTPTVIIAGMLDAAARVRAGRSTRYGAPSHEKTFEQEKA